MVLFLYNPFARPVMAQVVDSVKRSYHQHPRPILVAYMEPKDPDLWAETGFLERVAQLPGAYREGGETIVWSSPAAARRSQPGGLLTRAGL